MATDDNTSPKANLKAIHTDEQAKLQHALARLPKPIVTLHTEGKRLLGELLEHCFSAIDDTLFDLAKNAVKQEDQDDYFAAMRNIRGSQKTIIQAFASDVDQNFSSLNLSSQLDSRQSSLSNIKVDQLSVVGNEDLDEIVAMETIASRANKLNEHPLKQLAARIASIVPAELDHKQIPVSPDSLCSSFSKAIKTLDLQPKARLVIFKLFEQSLVQQLGPVYQHLNTLLIERGILPEGVSSFSAKPVVREPSNIVEHDGSGGLHMPVESLGGAAELGVSHQQHQQFQTSSTHSLSGGSPSLLDLMANEARGSNATGSSEHYLTNLIKNLQSQRVKSGRSKLDISNKERSVIGVLDRMFSTVNTQVQMAGPVRQQFQKLQLPLAKVALNDSSFFSNPNHSARQLLNALSDEAYKLEGLSATEIESDERYRRISNIIEALAKTPNPTKDHFSALFESHKKVSEDEAKKEAFYEQQLIRAEQGRLHSMKCETLVNDTIRDVCQGMELKPEVSSIVRGAWKSVLLHTALKYGEESKQWDDHVETLIELVTSTQPYANEQDFQQAQESFQELKKAITSGLLSIDFDAFKTTKLINHLEGAFSCLNEEQPSKLDEMSASGPEDDLLDKVSLEDKPDFSSLENILDAGADDQQTEKAKAETEDAPVSEEPLFSEEPSPYYLEQAKTLTRGAWFDIKKGESKTRCRLAAIIGSHEMFIFVDRQGGRISSNGLNEVALMLENCSLVYLDSNHIFDSALESVISGLKKVTSDAKVG